MKHRALVSMILATIALATASGCAAGTARPEPRTNVATMDGSWMPSEQSELTVGDAHAKGRQDHEGETTYRPNREQIPRGRVHAALN